MQRQWQRAAAENPDRGKYQQMLARIVSSVVVVISVLPVVASATPPVSVPQACAPTYCIEVIATVPDQPLAIRVESNVAADASTTTVEMGRGFSIAFHSRYVEWKTRAVVPSAVRWKLGKTRANAAACLRCGTPGWHEVLGIAMTGIPESYGDDLSGISVCFWPIDRSSVGHGDGRTLRLGEKVCVAAPISEQ